MSESRTDVTLNFRLMIESRLHIWNFTILTLVFEKNATSLEILREYDPQSYGTSLHYLQQMKWIKITGEDPVKDVETRQKAEDLFKNLIKVKKRLVTEKEIANWVDEWRNIFPVGSNDVGYRYRGNNLECLTKMITFVRSHDYTKEEIFKATDNYVKKFALKNYKYMMQAHYFIHKKDVGSTLSSECEMVREGVQVNSGEGNYGNEVI